MPSLRQQERKGGERGHPLLQTVQPFVLWEISDEATQNAHRTMGTAASRKGKGSGETTVRNAFVPARSARQRRCAGAGVRTLALVALFPVLFACAVLFIRRQKESFEKIGCWILLAFAAFVVFCVQELPKVGGTAGYVLMVLLALVWMSVMVCGYRYFSSRSSLVLELQAAAREPPLQSGLANTLQSSFGKEELV